MVDQNYVTGAQTNGTRLKAAYQEVLKRRGVPYLSSDDPTLLMLYQVHGNLTPQQAQIAAQQAAQHFKDTGQAMDDTAFDAMLTTASGSVQGPDETDPAWDFGQAARTAYQDVKNLYGGDIDPTDPRVIAAYMRAGSSVGATMTQDQARQAAQYGADYYRATGQAIPDYAADQYAGQITNRQIKQPHHINPATWDALGSTGQQLYLSAAARKGYDKTDYMNTINATRPVGTPQNVTPGRGSNDLAQRLAGVY